MFTNGATHNNWHDIPPKSVQFIDSFFIHIYLEHFNLVTDILTVDFFARSDLNFKKNCARKCTQNTQKDT